VLHVKQNFLQRSGILRRADGFRCQPKTLATVGLYVIAQNIFVCQPFANAYVVGRQLGWLISYLKLRGI